MTPSFVWTTKLRFHEADPSGWMYFGRAFDLAHSAYEEWVLSRGFEWKSWFKNPDWAVPLRAVSADYQSIVSPGEAVECEVQVTRVGDSSFTLRTELKQKGRVCAQVESTHTFLSKQTGQKIPIPSEVRSRLAEPSK